jgi:hypothetical protein
MNTSKDSQIYIYIYTALLRDGSKGRVSDKARLLAIVAITEGAGGNTSKALAEEYDQVFICIYMYLYVCVYMYLYVFICIYMYLYVFICMCIYVYE